MEKVRVVKDIPGMLQVGDELTCLDAGGDFVLEYKDENKERFVSIDYVTVSNNVPDYFEFEVELVESTCCDCCDCECEGEPDMNFGVRVSNEEILARKEFFQKHLNDSVPGSESEVVFQNLIWFIEWLVGEKELLK